MCTHTNTQSNPWWRVDLGSSKRIGTIVLTNRGDCCGNRLTNFQIYIGDKLDDKTGGQANTPTRGTASYGTVPQGKSRVYYANGLKGRYVYIRIGGGNRILTLCEVQVTEYCPDNCFNWALNQPTTSSGQSWGGLNHYAVDGDLDNNHNAYSCFHSTTHLSNVWWRVDLGTFRQVSRVRITNRGDCCSNRINGFQIRLGSTSSPGQYVCNSARNLNQIVGGATNDFDCTGLGDNAVSRYVYVYLPGWRKILQLCEVQVFEQCTYKNLQINFARGKPAWQNSMCCGGTANRAVDGNRNSRYGSRSCTHTGRSRTTWWYVDLGQEYEISRVGIQNRGDCCGNRLSNFQIRIGNRKDNNAAYNPVCRTGQSIGQGRWAEYPCAFMRGRYVSIYKYNNDYLTLCEVEVYGRPVGNDGVGKYAWTNAVDTAYPASNAVDGNYAVNPAQGSCFRSKSILNPYLAIDLGDTRMVTSVTIYFMSGTTYRNNMKKAGVVYLTSSSDVTTGHILCGNITAAGYDGKKDSFNLICGSGSAGIRARYVLVQLTSITAQLGICEVKVASTKPMACNIIGRSGTYCRSNCPAGTGGWQCRKCPGGRSGNLYLYGTKTCVRPQGGSYYPTPGTRLEYTTNCSHPSAFFTVVYHGAVQHIYSKLCIFPANGGLTKPPVGSDVILTNKCKNKVSNITVDQISGVARLNEYPDVCIGPIGQGVPKDGTKVTYASCTRASKVLQAWDVNANVINSWALALNIKTNDKRFFYNSPYWGNPKPFADQNLPLSKNAWTSAYSEMAITALSVKLGGRTINFTIPQNIRGVYTLQELVVNGGVTISIPTFKGSSNMFRLTLGSGVAQTAYCTNFGFSQTFYTGRQSYIQCQGMARIGVTTSQKLFYGPIGVPRQGACLHISGGGFRRTTKPTNLVTWSGCYDSSRRLYFYFTQDGLWRQSRNGDCITTSKSTATNGDIIVTDGTCAKAKAKNFKWVFDPTRNRIWANVKGNNLYCVVAASASAGNGVTLRIVGKTSCDNNFAAWFKVLNPPDSTYTPCQRNKPQSAEGIGVQSGCGKMRSVASGIAQSSATQFVPATVYVLGHKRCQGKASCDPYMGTCDCPPGKAGLSCDLPCPTGRFGAGCRQFCACKNNGVCDPVTGKCNCTAGWQGPTCNTPCPSGTTGVGCKPCPCTANQFDSCDRFTGACVCKAGYGDAARKCLYTCVTDSRLPLSLRNKWGAGCVNPCRCSTNGVCNGVDGTCACKPGYRGTTCSSTCRPGTYGANCASTCQCRNGAGCNPINGTCSCLAGYYGAACDQPCKADTLQQCGLGCNKKCTCDQTRGTCDPVSCGCLTCKAGWQGATCSQKCITGSFGQNCASRCNCKNGATCDFITGACTCAPGWQGTDCNTPCASNQWGSGCTNLCQCSHGKCNSADGSCTCDPGWTGTTCASKCKPGFYGAQCAQLCGCTKYVINPNDPCDPVTGTCHCLTGRTGKCDSICPQGKYGIKCTLTCNCVTANTASCHQQTGACTCKPGFGGSDCGTACATGRWGAGCTQTCACHHHGSTCSATDGTCNCNPGWVGATCSAQCLNGTWGANCANKCKCNNFNCNPVDGTCICPAGVTGSDCSQTCFDGTYGVGCNSVCNCINGTCSPVDGSCNCYTGFTGADCGSVCPAGKFGAGCSQTCPNCQNSVHSTGSCYPIDGSCVCKPGWVGALCQDSCPVKGTWGDGCAMTCDCNGQGCDPETGACICDGGMMGPKCQTACPANTYGPGCTGVCQCFNGATCNPVNGACICPPGFYDLKCGSSCPAAHFGVNCAGVCQCKNGSCNPVDGSCICPQGVTGKYCDQTLKCPAGMFGDQCTSRCLCQNGTCRSYDGFCDCSPGFKGVNCESVCPTNYYGKGCSLLCSCGENGRCDNVNGNCVCNPGYIGSRCQTPCPDGKYGVKCVNTCACIEGKVCDKVNGVCPPEETSSSESSSNDTTKIVVPIVVILVAILVIVLLAVWYTKRSVESKMPPGIYAAEADDITFQAAGAGGLENPTYASATNAAYMPDDKVEENPLAQ